ncbi:MAG: hypothetical protein JWM58_1837 [Rhizobium sp.]|nr:hypothetical protein [Rhizobium sp.]
MFEERRVNSHSNAPSMAEFANLHDFKQPRGMQRALDRIELTIAICVVFFSPMNFLRLPLFYFTLSDALACVCFFLLLMRGRLSLHPIGPASTLIWLIGLSMLLSMLLLSSLVNDPIRGAIYVTQYFFAYFIILCVIGGRSERQLYILAKIYILSIIVMCIHGVYLINIDGQRATSFVSGNGRLTGFVERENECAALIALATPILMLLVGTKQLPKVALLGLALMGYGVMLTGSNTGLASFAAVVAVFALLTVNWKMLVPLGAFCVGIVLMVDRFGRDYLPVTFQRRVLGALESGNLSEAGSFDHRVELIYEAIGRTRHAMFVGMGADQYTITSFLKQPVHNLYLLLWTEGGLLCMLGFIVMISAGFGPALVALRRPGGRIFAACTLCTVGLFMLSINAFPSVYGRFWTMPIFLAISMSCAFLARRTSPTASSFPDQRRPILRMS